MALYNDAAGKPLRKVFSRFGTERSRNLADLSSTTNSLSNLLGGLDLASGRTFIADDVTVIKNIFANGLTNEGYLNVVGSRSRFYSLNGLEQSFDPRITYQNRLDRIEVFSGNPRFLGGNGLTANYFQNDQILFDQHDDLLGIGTGFSYGISNVNDSGEAGGEVFGGTTADGELPSDNFWEEGDFEYSTKVHPQASKVNTGVKWEGYYVPSVTGPISISIESTGYFTLDFNKEGYAWAYDENNNKVQTAASISAVGAGQTYTEHIRIGISTSFNVTQFEDNANVVEVLGNDIADKLAKMNTIGIGMTVKGSGIAEDTLVESIDKGKRTITLTPPDGSGTAITNPSLLGETTFARKLGDPIKHVVSTHVLEEYGKYRIRMRYFHHKDFDSKDIIRLFNIDAREQINSTFFNLRYNRLFSLDYDFTDSVKGTFNKYYDNSVLFGGTKTTGIGGGDPVTDTKYVKLETTNKIIMSYEPPVAFDGGGSEGSGKLAQKREIKVENKDNRNEKSKGMIVTGGSPILKFRTNSFSNDIEIGNLIVSTQNISDGSGNNPDPNTGITFPTFNNNGEASIPFYARVKDIVTNNYIVMDMNALSAEGSNASIGSTNAAIVKFVDHRGLVRRVRVNSSSGTTITSSVSTNPFTGRLNQDGSRFDPNHTTINADVQVDMIAVGDNIPPFTKVDSIAANGESLTLSNSVTVRQGQDIFFYDFKGLRDNSLKSFCDRFSETTPNVQCLKSVVLDAEGDPDPNGITNTNKIIVNDLKGIDFTGWTLQGIYFGTSPTNEGIEVTSVDTSNKELTLASDIIGTLPHDAQFTASNMSASDDRTLCCPPTDTSPPFIATVDGLNTTEEYKNLKIDSGNVVFESLLLQDNQTSNNAEDITANDSVNRTIEIKTPLSTDARKFKILARAI